jgi:Outer membrane protein beta-barrel family
MKYTAAKTIFFLIILLFVAAGTVSAQERSLQLFLKDSLDKTPVENCSVSFMKPGDSASKKYFFSDKQGSILFKTVFDTVIVSTHHHGYVATSRMFVISGSSTAYISLLPAIKELEDVIVKSPVPVIRVNKDTTEFNVDSFPVEPYEMVADLLKKLPGLEFDENGKLLFQGKEIDKITVDGEVLFGGDNDFVLNKIPASFLSRIQVMDSRTLEEIFNGTPPDGEKKTLNIKLKPGLMSFANLAAMMGTREQAQLSLTLTQLHGKRRVFSTGSLNSQNRSGSVNNGPVSVTNSAGINYSDTWGKINFRSSYNYSANKNATDGFFRRQQFITSDSFFLSSTSNFNKGENNLHRGSLGFTWNPDTMNSITVDLGLSFSGNNSVSGSVSESFEQAKIKNLSERYNESGGNRNVFTGTAFWGHRMNKRGRGFTVNWKQTNGINEQIALNRSDNDYYLQGQFDKRDSTDQRIVNNSGYITGQLNLTFTEPLTKYLRLQLRTDISYQLNNSERYTYNKDSTEQYKNYDSLYSNELTSRTRNNVSSVYLYYNNKKLNIFGGFTTNLDQTNRTIKTKDNYKQRQVNYAPAVSATYNIDKTKNLRLSFSGRTVQANLDQMQPLPDNSNPLYIRVGNPGLKNAFVQSFTTGYSQTVNRSEITTMFSVSFSWSPEINSMVNAVSYDAYRRQTSQWINVDRLYSASGNISYSRSFLQNKHYNVLSVTGSNSARRNVYFHTNRMLYTRENNVRANLSLNRRKKLARFSNGFTTSLSFHYGTNQTPEDLNALNSVQTQVSPRTEASYFLFKKIYLTLAYQGGFNYSDFNAMKGNSSRYAQHSVQSTLNYSLKQWFGISTTMAYNKATGSLSAIDDRLTWNAEANASFFKDRRLYLRLAAYDILNTYNSFSQFAGADFIQQSFTNSLRSYFALHVQYNLSHRKSEK